MSLTVVILTKNEERHIARAIGSVMDVADRLYVFDSGSRREAGAEVLNRDWVNYATQLN